MEPVDTTRLAFDDVVIDVAGRRVLRGGEPQSLEPKAFDVLTLLASEPGRAFARDDILDAVWGHRHITPGVLNRVMTLLRHALGEDAQHPRYLHTVHGVGYRMDLPDSTAPLIPEAALSALPRTADAIALPATVNPLGTRPKRRVSDHQRDGRGRFWPRTALLLCVLAVLAFAGWRLSPQTARRGGTATAATAAPVVERSIAVLPLANASNDKEQQYFSDGLSETLINTLSRFDGLKVIGRTSAFQFRDSKEDSRTIGRKLGVSWLLSGSVQHAGDVVRINAALTNAADGSTLWAEHYDRPYKDLFALQDEIAQAVAGALRVKLLSPEAAAKQDDRPPSGNLEAYSAYLQGLQYWHDEDFPKAAGYMNKAVQLDPDYAVAWAHLSGSWSTTAAFSDEPPALAREHMRIAHIAADKALQLAPELGAAHAARAYLFFYEFDARGALAECRRAVQLAPDDGTVLNGCGYTLTGIGKLGEAIRLRERLLSIEPLYTVNDFQYAKLLLDTGRLDEAQKYLSIAEGLSPPKSSPSVQLYVAIVRGDVTKALDAARNQPSPWREMNLAIAMQLSADRTAADAALAKVIVDKHLANTSAYSVAQAYALRGDADRTVEWLERSAAGDTLFLLANPLILRFRDDPRLIAFCKKIGLPSPETSEALSIDQIRASLAAKH